LWSVTISLNGERVDTREAKTIAELIDRYQLPPQSILVEHNGLAVHRHEWAERPLTQGDRVEFIRVVAGG
jgi:thiamine biosynthesis protein ThiS